jgi:Family of unknown function (DUF6600)
MTRMQARRWLGFGSIVIGCMAAIACAGNVYVPVASGPPVAVPVSRPAAYDPAADTPFYDDLAPYGHWVQIDGPGWVWYPDQEPAGWRPYELGHWVLTDYGWTWASDEDYGWAVYHYGRWHQDRTYGWVWVPGTEWGPAWVAWHEGGGWVGWAPLPWQVQWRAEVGLDWGGLNINVALGPSAWCFVQTRNLIDPGLRHHIAPPTRNFTLIRTTQNVTTYTYVENHIVNQSIKVEGVGRAVGHTIPRYRVRQDDTPALRGGGKVRGEDFVVFRPNTPRGHSEAQRTGPADRGEERGHDARPVETRPGHREFPDRSEAPPADTPPADTRPADTPRNDAPPARPERVTPPRRGGAPQWTTPPGHAIPPHQATPQPTTPEPPQAKPQGNDHGAPHGPGATGRPAPPAVHPATPAASKTPADTKAGGAKKATPSKGGKTRGGKAKPKGQGDDEAKPEKPDSGKAKANGAGEEGS